MRNFSKVEHEKRLSVARELLLSGLPVNWIAKALGINSRTVMNSVKPNMRTKLSHGTGRFKTVLKNYAYHRQLNARGKEAWQAKMLTEEWLGLNRITNMFQVLDLFMANLFVPSYLSEHRGYIALLKEVLNEKNWGVELLWQEYLSVVGRCANNRFPLPKDLAETEERFMSFVAERCRKNITTPWAEKSHMFIDSILAQLPHREAQVICKRFAVGGEATIVTLRQIEQDLKISAERVRQIEQATLKRLRRPPFKDALRNMLRIGQI